MDQLATRRSRSAVRAGAITQCLYYVPSLAFSPDGKRILLMRNTQDGGAVWLIPYPVDASHPPRRILQDLPAFGGTPSFSWMPDNRHMVVATTTGPAVPARLYMVDTVSGKFEVLSSGTTAEIQPAVSPDGNKLVFAEVAINFDIVSVDLATAAVTPVIATQRSESMAAWALGQPAWSM